MNKNINMEDKEITIEDFLKDVEPEFNAFKDKLEKYEGPFKLIYIEEQGYTLEIDIANLKLKQ